MLTFIKIRMKKIALLIILLTSQFINAQVPESYVITTGVPFLLVAADARAAGMADQGVATSPDNFSQQWNPAKYAFATDKQGFTVSYTPYLTDLGPKEEVPLQEVCVILV